MQSPDQQHALDAVLARAGEDVAFRRALLSEPHRAIRDAFGITIPAGFRIRFVEKADDVDALVVLPDLERAGDESNDRELSDSELEVVAGGAHPHAAHRHMWKNSAPPPPRRSV